MTELSDGWLCCGLCRWQVDKLNYQEQLDRPGSEIREADIKAILIEEANKGDRRGGGSSDSGRPKNPLGGAVDPETKGPSESPQVGRWLGREDRVVTSTETLNPLVCKVQVRGLEEKAAWVRGAVNRFMRKGEAS